MTVVRVFFDEALLPDGWARDVAIDVDGAGAITDLRRDADSDGYERLAGVAVPGMPNLHSHAFQRAMAGLAERAGGAGRDSFWSWREVMYHFVERLEPDDCAGDAVAGAERDVATVADDGILDVERARGRNVDRAAVGADADDRGSAARDVVDVERSAV